MLIFGLNLITIKYLRSEIRRDDLMDVNKIHCPGDKAMTLAANIHYFWLPQA